MNNLKPINITSYGNNGTLNSQDHSRTNAEYDINTISQLSKRLQQMEIVNLELESIVEERTRNLAEVVASNAKSLSIIAHDLRSPFQTIVGSLDLLRESFKEIDKAEIELYLDLASKSVEQTLSLLDNLLAWTVFKSKNKAFNPVKMNLNETVLFEIESVDNAATQKQVTIINTINPRLFVTADHQMVKTIFRNLLTNAIKYSNSGGEVFINAIEKRQFVEVEVIDNGIGISLNNQKDLFDVEEYHSSRGTKNEKGTGLGLILCKEFVQMHGGIIWIESDTDKGCKVRFTLPIKI